ncbi:hypothetical protein B0H19DRAFT_1257379 [Mycena capillaripes]|nr:hypothetical protein B0H19DRAFT_1257379 [Mycena capillaripes]
MSFTALVVSSYTEGFSSALLIGTWASSLLYTAEILQASYYFSKFKDDDWRLKMIVAVAVIIDTVSALGDYACVYLYTVTHAGDLAYASKQNWAVPLYLISTSCVAILIQSFLVFRYWRFTNNTIVVALLSMLILASFGGAFASGLVIVLFPAFKDRTKVRVSGTVFIVTQVSADFIIAGALVYEFQKAKSKFMEGQRRIHNALNLLVVLTIQTGSAKAIIAVAALILFLINDETNISVGIMYSLGRVYVLSMLLNLNIRISGNERSSQDISGTATRGRHRGVIVFTHGTGTSETDGLRSGQFQSAIISTFQVHIDGQQALNGTVKSSSHTTEDPPAKIEMTATDSLKKQSELFVV